MVGGHNHFLTDLRLILIFSFIKRRRVGGAVEEKSQRVAFGKCLFLPQDVNIKQSRLVHIDSEVLCENVGGDCFLSGSAPRKM